MIVIRAFVKVVEKPEYATDVLNGRLYMNTLRYLMEQKEDPTMLRGDHLEGLGAWYQPNAVTVDISNVQLPTSDLAGPISVQMDNVLDHNVFCLFSLNSRGHETVSSGTLSALKADLQLPRECTGLGNHCVVIHQAQSFIDRCIAAIRKLGLGARLNLVEYFDDEEFHGAIPEYKQGFFKRRLFQRQREYRIVLDTRRSFSEPFMLEVGSLQDIAHIMTPEEFNRYLVLELPDGAVA